MKKRLVIILLLTSWVACFSAFAFRFAFITDLHIRTDKNQPTEDLTCAVNEINSNNAIDFVIIGGDVTESGDSASLCKAKELLDKLNKPYYITFGNHDVRQSPPDKRIYMKIFGSDRFSFLYKNILFVGFTTAPVSAYGVGHISKPDLEWVNLKLKEIKPETPVIVTTHYPLQGGDVDNWFEMTDILRIYNVQAVLNGHYHRNAVLNYDGIPGIVNRSTLRGSETKGGYSIYTVSDSLSVAEKLTGIEEREWLSVPLEQKIYDKPDYSLRK